jgi:hypothetical protein
MIDLDVFSQKREYLYHLTSRVNLPSIIDCGALWSASELFERAHGAAAREDIRRRRPGPAPEIIVVDGRRIEIRDQHTISEVALPKCLDDGMKCADYYELLNLRVFLWPTIERLNRHYARYATERPVLLRFPTRELLELNPHVEFSRLNSGATRPNSHLGGIAPRRGRSTFKLAETCNFKITEIAEVTFPRRCVLPSAFKSAKSPAGRWSVIGRRA